MSGVTQADVQALGNDTPRDRVKQRPGPGGRKPLDYVTARFVMDRLDEVVGPGNWQDRYEDRPNGSVRCGIGVNVEGEWIWKWDVGDESDIEAEKGAHSGAFKRAGVKWGIARDLYGEDNHTEAPQARQNGSQRPAPPRLAPRAIPPQSNGTQAQNALDAAYDAGDPYADLPNDWDKSLPPVAPTALPDPRDGYYGDTCPVHVGRPWKETGRGIKCTANDGTRDNPDWCTWKPSKRWIAEHETVPA